MAGPTTREESPRGRAQAGTGGSVTAIPAIVALLTLGLILRLIIAYVFLPGSGFPNDLGAFQAWGDTIAQHGPIGFYDQPGFLDYPPVYLLLLGAVSFVSGALTGGGIGEGVKLIPMLADLGLATLVWKMALEMGISGRRAFIAALIIVVNPITWFNSAIWGQADAVGSIILLLGLRELQKDRRETASALAVLALLTKLQLGILGVVVGFVVLRRSIAPKTGEPDPERILTSVGAGLLTAALVCLPFTGLDFLGLAHRLTIARGLLTLSVGAVAGVGVFALVRRYAPVAETGARNAVAAAAGAATVLGFAAMVFDSIVTRMVNTFGEYPYLTLNAYNPWSLVGNGDGSAMSRSLSWLRDAPYTDPTTGVTDPGYLVGPFPATVTLVALVLAAVLGVLAYLAWNSGRAEEQAAPAPAATPTGRGARLMPWVRDEFHGMAGPFGAVAAVLVGVAALSVSGGVYAAALGSGALVLVLMAVGMWAAWRDDGQSLLVAVAILSIAFFVVPTRVHERYLFPFFGLGAILLVGSWRWRIAYVALAVVNTANLLGVLVEYKGIPVSAGGVSAQIAGTLNDWGTGILTAQWPDGVLWVVSLSGLVTGLVMIWALLQMRGRAVVRLADEFALAGLGADLPAWMTFEEPGEYEPGTYALDAAAAEVSAGGPTAPATGLASVEDSDYEDYADAEERPLYVPFWAMKLWHRISGPSTHPDRTASLDREPRGRLDKMDIWVVVALIIAVLSMRVYRLGEPPQMHFDEVYHARTATEFLQEWQYGIDHDIYEWTHPHFAKYAIAASISLFDDYKVTSTASLGVPVKAVLVQPRTGMPPGGPASTDPDATVSYDTRYGDRVFVATGSGVRVYDLETRALAYTYDIPGASAFSEVGPTGMVYVGTTDGHVWRIDTNTLDDYRSGKAPGVVAPVKLTVSTDISIAHVFAGAPPYLLVSDAAGTTVSINVTAAGGAISGRGLIPGAADFAPLGSGPTAFTADLSKVTNAGTEAEAIASLLGIDAQPIQAALTSQSVLQVVLPLGLLTSDQVTAMNSAIASGELPGIAAANADPQILVAYRDGVGLVDARYIVINSTLPTDAPATSIAINDNSSQDSYVTAGNSLVLLKIDSSGNTPTAVLDGNQNLSKMPGAVTQVVFDPATRVAHILGRTPDGTGWTVYALESNGNAVFDDAPLPFEPVAIGIDSTTQMPDASREALLAFAPDGSIASVDVGQFAFSWRLMGVLFGTLMAVCMYLLVRLLFRRRTVGLLLALFTLVDGMLFAQSRIAMNDTYVGGLLLLGYLIFAILWLDVWKSRIAFWLGMPLLGVVLGLALASKWVAVYAIASIGVLILIRSALGRLIAILGMAAGTGVLGWMAIAEMNYAKDTGNPALTGLFLLGAAVVVAVGTLWAISTRLVPDKVFIGVATAIGAAVLLAAGLAFSPGSLQNGAPNYTFFIIMLAATALAAAANGYRPVAWTREELYFAIGAPIAVGLLAGLLGAARQNTTLIEVGGGGISLGIAAAAGFFLLGRIGFGPLAVTPDEASPASYAEPPSPAPKGWLRLGSGFGLPAIWMGACVAILPLVVYVVMYLPWAKPWESQVNTGPNATVPLPVLWCFHTDTQTGLCDSAFPAGHTGQTLWDLTIGMYNYHNDLRASHAASSPWWAWPMDLKPVWFDSGGNVQGMGAWIHDGGNPALWWLAIFAMGFITWQAFKRRSLGLTLIALAFFWQWLSWARVDRASFQYHFYTALPFFLMALAYFLAELWHGPSRRTWLLARVAGAAALLFPGVMWLLKPELCGLARVDTTDYFGNTACGASTGDVILTAKMVLIGLTLVVAMVAMGIVLWRLERRQERGIEDQGWILQLLAPVGAAFVAIFWLGQAGPNDVILHAALPSDLLAIVFGVVGIFLALIAITARNPRRFVLGVCVAGVLVFLALYPDLSALWVPNKVLGVYYAPLPTWLYGFQFSVNLQASNSVKLISSSTMLAAAFTLFVAAIAAWVAWERRVVVGYYRANRPAIAEVVDVAPVPDPEAKPVVKKRASKRAADEPKDADPS